MMRKMQKLENKTSSPSGRATVYLSVPPAKPLWSADYIYPKLPYNFHKVLPIPLECHKVASIIPNSLSTEGRRRITHHLGCTASNSPPFPDNFPLKYWPNFFLFHFSSNFSCFHHTYNFVHHTYNLIITAKTPHFWASEL